MKLSFQIAARFLKSNLSQTFLIILGIGIGISVQIFIGSLIQGLQKSLVEKTIGSSSQITIKSADLEQQITDYDALMQTVKNADKAIQSVSPVYDNAVLMNYNEKTQSLLVRGLDFKKADRIYKITDSITEGTLPNKAGEVLLGASLKETYGFAVGDTINLITPDKNTTECTISGFYDLKVAQINNSWCLMPVQYAQQLSRVGNVITAVEIQVKEKDVFSTDVIAENVAKIIGTEFTVTDWKAQNEQLLSGLSGQSTSSLMIQIFVMISVILGIASVLAITVLQKSKQIGILKAMGIKNTTASFIFLFEGLILGLFGAVAGILLGLGLATSFSTFALNADGTPIVALFIDRNFIILSGVIAIFACVLAALIPARRSSKLNPIDIIRNN